MGAVTARPYRHVVTNPGPRIYFKLPDNFHEMSDEEQAAFAEAVLDALLATVAAEEDADEV